VKQNGTKRYICETKRTETNQNNNVPKPWVERQNFTSEKIVFAVFQAGLKKWNARIFQFSKFIICQKHNIFKILSKFEFLF
jgi:hypothetical protein